MTHVRRHRTAIVGLAAAGALVLPTSIAAVAQDPDLGINETCDDDQEVLFDDEFENGMVQVGDIVEGATYTEGAVTVTITDVHENDEGEAVSYTHLTLPTNREV